MTAPPPTEPIMYAVTVSHHRLLRLRSPNGEMLESIDSPQGDHVDRTAATTASTTPSQNTRASGLTRIPSSGSW